MLSQDLPKIIQTEATSAITDMVDYIRKGERESPDIKQVPLQNAKQKLKALKGTQMDSIHLCKGKEFL